MIYKFNKYRDKHGYIKLEEIKKEPLWTEPQKLDSL